MWPLWSLVQMAGNHPWWFVNPCFVLRRHGSVTHVMVGSCHTETPHRETPLSSLPPKADKVDYRERHAAECGINCLKMRHQPPQEEPSRRHEIRQTRGPL
ncbi:hypothetical protein GCM10010433_65220 [Streptomyces pulveraceus]